MRKLIFLFLLLCSTAWADGLDGLSYKAMYAGGATPTRTESGRTVFATGTSSQINYNWGTGSVMGGPSDGVIIHWTGYLKTPGTSGNIGIYFYNSSDDGFSVALNGTYILNNWREQGNSYYNSSAGVTLAAGTVYAVDMWYYENGGGAVAQWYWNTGSGITLVPSSALGTTSTHWAPVVTITGYGSSTVITTTTSGSTVYTYSQPVTITYYSDGSTSTANNGSPTLLSTTTTGGSTGISNSQQSSVNSAYTQQANLPSTSHVYIDQIGSGDSVTVNQQNQYNLIGGQSQTGVKLRGGNNTLVVHQGDPSNTASTHNIVGIDLLGGSNTLTVNQGTDSNGYGSGSDAGWHYSSIYVNGVNNILNVQQQNTNSVGNYASINITGNQNNQSLIQTGTGSKQLFTTINGNLNTETVSQTGPASQFADVNLTGNGNSATVTQSGSSPNSAQINLINAGGPASVNLTQTGGQSYSITQTCVQAGGCAAVTVKQGP